MTPAPRPSDVLRAYLADAAASFAIGVPAAVAEFLRDPGEPVEAGAGGLSIATPRGGVRLTLSDEMRPLAIETPSRRPGHWLQSVVFLLPEAEARMGGRRVLSALGPDDAALTARDRADELFDLGVGAPHVDFCVRTPDPALIARLRAACGQAMADWPQDLASALLAANPHRVVVSRLGRIEVTGPIPRARTPLGPHTHLFPEKLGDGATHDPDLPLPAGWLPCLTLYPPHPQADLAGDPVPFDRARHAAFQALLEAWGEPGYLAAKARALAALRATGEARQVKIGSRQRGRRGAPRGPRRWRAGSGLPVGCARRPLGPRTAAVDPRGRPPYVRRRRRGRAAGRLRPPSCGRVAQW